MVTKVDEFKSAVARHNGFSKFSRYRIVFPTLFIGDDTQALTAVCRQAMFPGKQINTFERRTNQKSIPVASGYSVDTVQLSLIETADQMVSKYMDFWLDMVVSPRDYLLSYRDEYARDVLMLRLNEQDEVQYAVLLRKAFPKTKILMDYSYDNMNNFAELTMTFDYEDYEVIPTNGTELIRSAANAVRAQNLKIPLPVGNTTLGRAINLAETGRRLLS